MNMNSPTEKGDKGGAVAKTQATKAPKRANRDGKSIGALIEAGMLEDAFNEAQCGNCDRLRKTTYIWGLAFWFMVFFYLIIGVAAVTLVHANQIDAGGSDAGGSLQLVARGLEVDTTTSVMDSACSLSSTTSYPAPSAAFVAATVDGTIATGGVTVTPITAQANSEGSVCPSAETVTVTVTTLTDNDAVTAGAGGAPPQSSEGSTSSSSSVLATITMTEAYTVTNTVTVGTMTTSSPETDSTTTQVSTPTSTDLVTTHVTSTTTQFITMLNSTGTTTTTTTVDPRTAGTPGDGDSNTPSLISTLGSMVIGTSMLGTGTGTGTAYLQPSSNGSLTYSVPTVSPSQVLPSVVSSSGSSTSPFSPFSPFSLAIRGTGGGGGGGEGAGKRDQSGGKSGFYCIVMAVACAAAVLV
ncbi:uncharacterized protein B0H64DRAFT_459873 [Chaetomium fimeti]|uniref:Uncharacterized protein n=1 Tax=Chaetomium fimeti TaxID=1854472 RepID=A0AAE0HFS6_9PEZI|nr:hypothetical protein B0H64DRAFT_459873 [Chaetomium fimeti]